MEKPTPLQNPEKPLLLGNKGEIMGGAKPIPLFLQNFDPALVGFAFGR